MNCRETKKQIEAYMEGRMPDTQVLHHMEACPECAAEYRAAKALRAAFRAEEKTDIPGDFNKKVWAKIGEPSPSLLDRLFGTRPTAGFAFKAAAAVAAVVFLVIVGKMSFVKNEATGTQMAAVKETRQETKDKSKAAAPLKACNEKVEVAAKEGAAPQAPAPDMQVANQAPLTPQIVPVATAEELIPGRGPAVVAQVKEDAGEKNGGVVRQEPAAEGNNMSAAISKNPTPVPTCEPMKEEIQIMSNVIRPGEAMRIKYCMKEAGSVTIVVFNTRGEPVATLAKEDKQAGTYEVSWRGYDDNGAAVGAGTYIVCIKAGGLEKRIKAAVVK